MEEGGGGSRDTDRPEVRDTTFDVKGTRYPRTVQNLVNMFKVTLASFARAHAKINFALEFDRDTACAIELRQFLRAMRSNYPSSLLLLSRDQAPWVQPRLRLLCEIGRCRNRQDISYSRRIERIKAFQARLVLDFATGPVSRHAQ